MIGSVTNAVGFIYFLRPVGMRGPIKIGFSAVPEARLRAMMSWSPFPLEIVTTREGPYRLEQQLHGLLAASHSHGEWFHATDEVVRVMEGVASGELVDGLIMAASPLRSLRKGIGGRPKGWRLTPAPEAA